VTRREARPPEEPGRRQALALVRPPSTTGPLRPGARQPVERDVVEDVVRAETLSVARRRKRARSCSSCPCRGRASRPPAQRVNPAGRSRSSAAAWPAPGNSRCRSRGKWRSRRARSCSEGSADAKSTPARRQPQDGAERRRFCSGLTRRDLTSSGWSPHSPTAAPSRPRTPSTFRPRGRGRGSSGLTAQRRACSDLVNSIDVWRGI
jgi:hypothetical protein